MRIDRLQLTAFGPFAGVELDLSAGSHGVHVVYGPNEAGKSSLLRALAALLFGYERQGENWRHDYKSFRLGAELRNAHGETLAVVRLKKNKDALVGADDEPLAEATLGRFLAGCERAEFESVFFMDADRLEHGGKEIATGQGKLGALLFAASGAASARKIANELQKEAADLFLAKGRNQRISVLLKSAADERERERAAAVPVERYLADKAEQARLEADRAELAIRESDARRQASRWEKLAKIKRHVAAYRRAEGRAAEFAEALRLPADLLDRSVRHEANLEHLQRRFSELQSKRAALADQRATLATPDPVLRMEKELKDAAEARAANVKARVDRAKLADRIKTAEANVAALASRARTDADTPEISLPLAEEARKLAERKGELSARRTQLREEQAALDEERRRVSASLAEMGATRDPSPLRDSLETWRAAEQTFQERTRLEAELAQLRAERDAAFARLPYWRGALAELPVAKTPTAVEVETARIAWQNADAARENAWRRAEECRRDLQNVTAEMERLAGARLNVATADWSAAKATRDEAWKRLAERLESRKALAGEVQAEIAAYRAAVEAADRVAERLLAAERASAMSARLEVERTQAADALQAATARVAAAERTCEKLRGDWQADWAHVPIDVRPPAEMAVWLEWRDELAERVARIDRLRAQAAALDDRLHAVRRAAAAAFAELGENIPANDASWEEVVRRARKIVAACDADAKRRADLENALAKCDVQAAELAKQSQRETRAETGWREAWAEALARLGLSADPSPSAVVEIVAAREEIAAHRREIAGWRQRIFDIDADETAAQERYFRLAARLDAPVDSASLDHLAATLVERLERAKDAAKRRAALDEELREADAEIEKKTAEISQAEAALKGAFLLAGVEDFDGLRAACARSRSRHEAEQELAAKRETLESLAGGEPLAAALEAAEAEDEAAIGENLEAAARRLDDFENDRTKLADELAACKARLGEIERTDARAAHARQEMQVAVAEAGDLARRYAVLRGSVALLERAIERYRERHEGPLLERARALFRRLTGGSFANLAVEEENGQPTLFAIRADESRLGLEKLSDGSADQLYLALRLAGLERYFDTHEAMPLVLDDLLLSFDDDRARHALEVLGELSTRTQILFLTHHRHLVELAESSLPRDRLFVHRLA